MYLIGIKFSFFSKYILVLIIIYVYMGVHFFCQMVNFSALKQQQLVARYLFSAICYKINKERK